ncbi:MAG: transcriptional repressor LexA [Candidatus Metalachnospira sp.]|nr:transcriptional repressor LexA [Candidatus Metalachnospira sp.]
MRSKNTDYFKLLEEFIDSYRNEYGSSPTVREIADNTKLSTATVSRYLSYMKEQGMIDYKGHRNITTRHQRITNIETVEVPVLGAVSCGLPKYAEGNIEEYVRLPVSIFGRGEYFLLRANGDSMIEVGIDDGDLVLVKKQNFAENGQIVVALMEDEATLKRFYSEPRQRRIRLHPENSKMKDIYVSDCIIQGIAVKVLKDVY